ncbi:MAG TPA: sporulation-delaying protein SdpB family protein [Myxococcaceae bacterium]|nr:sporulation-delaying protein SdpB family protein [Myxococcaceae bacterium]
MLTRSDRPWTNVYGLARSLLALATLLTLVSDSGERLFHPLTVDDPGIFDRSAIAGASLFFLARDHLGVAKLVAIIVLLLVISGWRPRLTALPHWWISYSFAASASMIDGGDQVAATLTLLLLPVALTDSRRSHWTGIGTGGTAASIAAQTGLVLVRVQMAVVYLFAAVLKFPSEEWANGTALYYWWQNPIFGSPGFLRPLMAWIGRSLLVVPLTWGVLLLELALAGALVAPLRFRARLLPLALLFHAGIAVIHGMPTFALAMVAGLVLYLRPTWQSFPLPAPFRRPVPRRAEPVAQPSIAR